MPDARSVNGINFIDELGAVESVKSASDIFAPMSGQVFEVNEELTSNPSLINKSAEQDGIPSISGF